MDVSAAPSPFRYESWEEKEGLPHYSINAIAQDGNGYLWLGTYYGLVRFDGLRFVVFDRDNTPALPSNQVSALAAGKDGAVWVGTGAGLACIRNSRVEPVPAGVFPAISVHVLAMTPSGGLLIGTNGRGLYELRDNRAWQAGLPGEAVRALHFAPGGTLWAGTHRGLYQQVNGGFRLYSARDGLPDDRVLAVLGRRQDLWIGTRFGLARLSGGRIVRTSDARLRRQTIWSLLPDPDGSLWIGTFGAGLYRLQDGTLHAVENPNPLSSRAITALFRDREGSLWIGTSGGGLSRLKRVPFQTITTADGLSGNLVQAVLAARDGDVWVGLNGGGLARLRHGQPAPLRLGPAEGLSDEAVWSLHQDRQGDIWAGTYPGKLNRIRGAHITVFGEKNGLPGSPILTMLDEPGAGLWVGTMNHGLLLFRGGAVVKRLDASTGLASNHVRILFRDRRQRLWIGTNKGLHCLENGQLRVYTASQGLGGNYVFSLKEDADGTLWIGTFDGGLTRFRAGRFVRFGQESGFPARSVFQILDDDQGYLWFGSSTGIFRVRRLDLDNFAAGQPAQPHFTAFGISDGLNSREVNGGQPAGCRTADGRLWFPTMKGLAVVDPRLIRPNRLPPPVVLEAVVAGGRNYAPVGAVEIPPGRRDLEFQFAAPSLLAPDKVRVRYRLLPYHEAWVEGAGDRSAHFTNLAPGHYRFQVIAANGDGVWNHTGAALDVHLMPRFYQTWWFYAALLLAASALLWAWHRWRLQMVVRLNRELERRVEERASRLGEANRELTLAVAQLEEARAGAERASHARSEFIANVSHEIRTPMSGILGLTNLLLDTPLSAEQREYLRLSRESAESLLCILNDILDLSKIDAGHLRIEPVPYSPASLVQSVARTFSANAAGKGLKLEVVVNSRLPARVSGDEARVRQVLNNLVVNALKFTQAGSITLSVSLAGGVEGNGNLRFCVADTGIGIPPDKQAVIFEPFRQADNSTARRYGGTGLGLTICARLVRAMEGRIWVESTEGGGSSFYFELPCRRLPAELPPAEAPAPTEARHPTAPARILLAEDNPVNQTIARRMLEKAGWSVEVVANGKQAVETALSQRFDVVLMDVQMPEMDGLEATALIRSREAKDRPRLPIVAMTAHAMSGDAERCLAAGMDAYLSKPIDADALVATVASLAHLAAAVPNPPSG
jgi:signal transduction histidine kinase/ligand-binding sensor domain-containing protein/CheY-like chemotaxis protein